MTPLLNLLLATCPQAQIDVLVKAEYRDLLRAHPGVTRLLPFDSQQPLLHHAVRPSGRPLRPCPGFALHAAQPITPAGAAGASQTGVQQAGPASSLAGASGLEHLAAHDAGARTLCGTPAASGPCGPSGSADNAPRSRKHGGDAGPYCPHLTRRLAPIVASRGAGCPLGHQALACGTLRCCGTGIGAGKTGGRGHPGRPGRSATGPHPV